MRNCTENKITLILLRHGLTESNRQHRYLGRIDEGLCEEGRLQLKAYRELPAYPEAEFLFASPMKRCLQTAHILYPNLIPMVIEEWKEMDFGAFEGKNYTELKGDSRYQEWIDSNGILPFPEGESREEFILRCEAGFQKMLDLLGRIPDSTRIKTIGAVVHGGTIMALLSRYRGGDYFDYQTANGRGYRCTVRMADKKTEIIGLEKL